MGEYVLSFPSASECRLHSLHSRPTVTLTGTYTQSGSRVSVTFNGKTYVFEMDGRGMRGNLFGSAVDLMKQD
jgi:hypothetical protein